MQRRMMGFRAVLTLVALGGCLFGLGARPSLAQGQTLAQRVRALERLTEALVDRVETLEAKVADQDESIGTLAVRLNAETMRAQLAEDKLRAALAKESAARSATDKGIQTGLGIVLDRTQYMSADDTTTRFTGCNVQIVNGLGATNGYPTNPHSRDLALIRVNGLGNLIVGYNERSGDRLRTGSHNMIIGVRHGYESYGGFIAGEYNNITLPYSSILGGFNNWVSYAGSHGAISGGSGNQVSGDSGSVSGGQGNLVEGGYASAISGGTGIYLLNGWGLWSAGIFHSP